MGPSDEEKEYAKECLELVELLGVEDVIFTGKVDVTEYLGRMDMTILTSISEGQPLTILESFAAKKPVIATDVGNCRGLIYGEGDSFGEAGSKGRKRKKSKQRQLSGLVITGTPLLSM